LTFNCTRKILRIFSSAARLDIHIQSGREPSLLAPKSRGGFYSKNSSHAELEFHPGAPELLYSNLTENNLRFFSSAAKLDIHPVRPGSMLSLSTDQTIRGIPQDFPGKQ
jgi:hypothetical protein